MFRTLVHAFSFEQDTIEAPIARRPTRHFHLVWERSCSTYHLFVAADVAVVIRRGIRNLTSRLFVINECERSALVGVVLHLPTIWVEILVHHIVRQMQREVFAESALLGVRQVPGPGVGSALGQVRD